MINHKYLIIDKLYKIKTICGFKVARYVGTKNDRHHFKQVGNNKDWYAPRMQLLPAEEISSLEVALW